MKILMENKRIKSIVAIVCVVTVIATFAYAFVNNDEVAYAAQKISYKTEVGGHEYTKDKKLNILEIVPDVALSELGYTIEPDNCEISWKWLMDKYAWDFNTWRDCVRIWFDTLEALIGDNSHVQVSVGGMWYTYGQGNYWNIEKKIWEEKSEAIRITDLSGNPYVYENYDGTDVFTTNIFAYNVFGGYDMCDKIELKVKTPNEITPEEIAGYDLIYVNRGVHYDNILTLAEKTSKISPAKLAKIRSNRQNAYKSLNMDLSAETAWEIYMAVANKETAFIMDSSTTQTYDADTNIDILYTLVYGAERDVFKEQFWENEAYGKYYQYYGTNGYVKADKSVEVIELSYIKNGVYQKVNWSQGCLAWINEINNGSTQVNYHNEGSRQNNIWDNTFSYIGDGTMTYDLMDSYFNATTSWTSGTSINHANGIYGNNENKIKFTDIILYILGEHRFEGVLKVLEIEPSGTYKYDELNADKVKTILGYFNYTVKGGITAGNYMNHVEVTSVSSNAFIGMTKDLASEYDLIIISDYNGEMPSIDTNIVTALYEKQGPLAELTDIADNNKKYVAALSGNDFTNKAYNKLINYIKSGKAVVVADSIYNADERTCVADTNVARLSEASLIAVVGQEGMDNIRTEGNNRKILTYYRPPVLTVDEKLTYNTAQGGIVKPTEGITSESLSDFKFRFNVGNKYCNYRIDIYFDKNADGFYTSTEGDNNELVYSAEKWAWGSTDEEGYYNVAIDIPESIRGYIQWKAVLTDLATGISSDEEGAVAIAYAEEEKTVVKVLQLTPGGKETLRLDNEKFLELFEAAEDTTGIVLDLTILTTEEYEAKYEKAPYMKDGVKQPANDLLTKRNNIGYDMIVLGTTDSYNYKDISDDNGALTNIVDYIKSGNAVLMSHDTMSVSSFSGNAISYNSANNEYRDENFVVEGVKTNKNVNLMTDNRGLGWSYNLTSQLRDIVGMDRYSVSAGAGTEVKYNAGYSNVFLMQYARKVNTDERLKLYNGMYLINTNHLTKKATRLNQGQITNYPYNIGQSLDIANTHAQYYQLDLESQGVTEENDVIVWYTLDGNDGSYYCEAGDDALNNYYIYSKGNITYSGAGHSAVNSEQELKLFVNTIIRAIGSGNNPPSISFEGQAIAAADGTYEQTVRETDKSIPVTFKVNDADMPLNGKFKQVYVFWDKNGSGFYDAEDVLIKEYNEMLGECVINRKSTTFELTELIGSKNSLAEGTLSTENKQTIWKLIENNEFSLSVQAEDNDADKGVSALELLYKQLFTLN